MSAPTVVQQAATQLLARTLALADALAKEMELDSQRPMFKSEAIARLMSIENPQKPGSNYSATAAEGVVMYDKAFALHTADRQSATRQAILAMGNYEVAKQALRLAVRSEIEASDIEPLLLTIGDDHQLAVVRS